MCAARRANVRGTRLPPVSSLVATADAALPTPRSVRALVLEGDAARTVAPLDTTVSPVAEADAAIVTVFGAAGTGAATDKPRGFTTSVSGRAAANVLPRRRDCAKLRQ